MAMVDITTGATTTTKKKKKKEIAKRRRCLRFVSSFFFSLYVQSLKPSINLVLQASSGSILTTPGTNSKSSAVDGAEDAGGDTRGNHFGI